MLLADAPLTLREYMTKEEVPLALIFREILEAVRNRQDVAVFGAHAVNAYCEPERMTQDVDLLSTQATALAEELRARLATMFPIAIRVREVVPGIGYRIYQLRTPKNRHLVDIRQVPEIPETQLHEGVSVLAPMPLVIMKVKSLARRGGKEKGLSDRLDLVRLLRVFPELRTPDAGVNENLASPEEQQTWNSILQMNLEPDDDEAW